VRVRWYVSHLYVLSERRLAHTRQVNTNYTNTAPLLTLDRPRHDIHLSLDAMKMGYHGVTYPATIGLPGPRYALENLPTPMDDICLELNAKNNHEVYYFWHDSTSIGL
jgi:hypothetical protein